MRRSKYEMEFKNIFRKSLTKLRSLLEPEWLIHAEISCARAVARKLPRIRRQTGTTHLLLTPFPRGSRGDEALLVGSLDSSREPLVVLAHRPLRALRRLVARPHRVTTIPGLIYALPPLSFLASLLFLARGRRAASLTVVGADLLDGAYWQGPSLRRILLSGALADLGVRVEVIGFSWPLNPDPACHRALASVADRISLRPRDSLATRRLVDSGISVNETGADVALGITTIPSEPPPEVARWLSDQALQGRRVLAAGLHGHLLPVETDVVSLSSLLKSEQQSWALLLVPMDERLFAGDRRRANALARWARHAGIPVCVVGRQTSVRDLLAILSRVSGVLAFRMHLSILAFRVGTPCIGVDYNDKFAGTFEHFDSEDYVIPRDQLSPQLANVWSSFRDSTEDLRHRVTMSLPRVRELAVLGRGYAASGEHS